MAAEMKRKTKAGSTRTEVFAMRLDPQLKYLAELLARKQRRSMANLIEWALETVLRNNSIDDSGNTAWDAGSTLWDVSESRRFVNLATHYPELLNYEEQCYLSTVKNYSLDNPNDGPRLCFFVQSEGKFLNWAIDECWAEIKEYSLETQNSQLRDALNKKMYQVLIPDS